MSWMIQQAAELKAAQQDRRNRGFHTGKAAKGWNAKRRGPRAGSLEYFLAAADALEAFRRGEAIEQARGAALDDFFSGIPSTF